MPLTNTPVTTPVVNNSSLPSAVGARPSDASRTVRAPVENPHRDHFAPAKASTTGTKEKEKSETVEKAKKLALQLTDQHTKLMQAIEKKQGAMADALNAKVGLLQTALHHGDKNLVALLQRMQKTSHEPMTNEQFLKAALQTLFGIKEANVNDWLKVATKSQLGESGQELNLSDVYRKLLARGKEVYGVSTQVGDQFKQLEQKRDKASHDAASLKKQVTALQAKLAESQQQKARSDAAVGTLVKQGKKNRERVNRETQAYLDAVTQIQDLQTKDKQAVKTGQALSTDLESLTAQIAKQLDEVNTSREQVNAYEARLAFVEALLGYDLQETGGNDVRVRLIKNAVSKTVSDTAIAVDDLKKRGDKIMTTTVALLKEVAAHETETSSWDRFFIRRKIKKLMEEATQAAA